MGFIHSLTLPQSNGWVKKESYDNGNQGTSRSSANTARNQDQTGARSQNQNPLKERNNSLSGSSRPPSDMASHVQPSYPQANTNNRNAPNNNYANNSSNHINNSTNNSNNTNTSSHPQPATYHQHHTHHQHQVPPHEAELSRFPPQDATYKASARQNQGSSAGYSQSASNNLPHQVAPSQQQQQHQQHQQQKLSLNNIQNDDYEAFSSSLEMFSPSSPNPAPHKSSKPNIPFVTTSSGPSSQSNMNNTNDGSMQHTFPSAPFNQYDSSVGIDTDDMESENCPATRIPEWCQDMRTSTPLSLSPDDTSGGCTSNYSDSNSPFDNDEKE